MSKVKDTYLQGLGTAKRYTALELMQLAVLFCFVCTLTLNMWMNSLWLFICLLLVVLTFKGWRLKLYALPAGIFVSGYILAALALLYSINRHEGGLILERQLALLFVPLVMFSSFKTDRVKFHSVLKVFFISMVAVSAYLITVSAQKFLSSPVTLSAWFVKDNLNHAFSRPIGMHATYLSLYVALAICVGLYWLLLNDYRWVKLLVLLCMPVFVVTLAMLSSRVVIFTVLAILFALYPFFIRQVKQKFLLLVGGLMLAMTAYFVVRESRFITDRFTERTDKEMRLTPFLNPDSTYNPFRGGETRADRWYCALELIKEKPLLGYGTGSEKAMLMKKYEKYNLQNAVFNHYDAHNQYLAYAIKGGLPALLAFLLCIGYAFYIAVKNRSFIYLAFTLLFAVTCVTENVLERNKGIFFFAFFNTFFSCYYLSKHKDPEQLKTE